MRRPCIAWSHSNAFAWRAAAGLAILGGLLGAPVAAEASVCVPASQWLPEADAERTEATSPGSDAVFDDAKGLPRHGSPTPGAAWCISPDDPRCAPGHQKGDGSRPLPDRIQGQLGHVRIKLCSPCRRAYESRAAADATRLGVRFRVERPPKR